MRIASGISDPDIKNVIISKISSRLPSFSYFYGAPKVHKPGVPLRPIIATCGSPQSNLAKWLASTLSPLLGKISGCHLLHSNDFIDRLRRLGPVKGKLMSLDVTALFTNVPLEFVLDNLKDAASTGVFAPPIHINKFCELIKLCVDATYFVFDDLVYQQKFGVAMGSPLSPILANLCMEFIEKNYIQSLPDEIKPKFWVRYVDDIFIIFQQNETAFNSFLTSINNILPTIKFTVEYENNNQLPFLDVLVLHEKDSHSFSFTVYRKETNSENYIHFYSHHSKSIKSNIVSNMFTRALRVCDPQHLDQEIQHIFQSFMKLGYPHHFINSCLSNAKRKWYIPKPRKENNPSSILSLPFSPHLYQAQKFLDNENHRSNPHSDTNIRFSYRNTIRNRLVKNSNRKSDNIGVYCIPCIDCDRCYVGESGRSLEVRLDEHRRACRLGSNYSAVATHSLDVGHRIGFKQSKVVYKSSDRDSRRTVEGALITLNKTFENNKSSVSENKHVSALICRVAKINSYDDISATLRTVAPPLFPQVLHDTGAYADPRAVQEDALADTSDVSSAPPATADTEGPFVDNGDLRGRIDPPPDPPPNRNPWQNATVAAQPIPRRSLRVRQVQQLSRQLN